ncbi:Golgi localized Arf binding gamma-adaptin-like protein Gga22 [Schizosaccharomyces osmophilus]|uniref:Golgi localized Arf binding gamma-adaptin-like protein Gga22 n=1 Tax=Schizosaccharomyces osmophilus TaxID=2545709 RepID=A0AAE9W6V4_9SCHI|nr:Golgi localized Arf binding gamma-adaptin-like protein Gga22 [Schizosaccharomyces osmophilus]WBW71040.1 Golgi localized Arf binding gamma-adaptin-like protein Gga22 [Schizosaccharomyces osmophilus]
MSSSKRKLYRLIQNATEPFTFEPDLALNLDITDLINQAQGNIPREAAFAIVRKVNDRNPTVAYLALNLLDICVKNCGYAFHLQIATKEFLNEFVRRFPERPPSRLNKIQIMILSLIEEWRRTICRTDRYNEDLGFIRDMHRLLSYKGYTFPEIAKDNLAVLSQKSVLKTAEELEKEDRDAMSAKLQEHIRRGTPHDLMEANKLMKVMAGYDSEHKRRYKEHVLVELEKVKRKASLFGEMLNEIKESDKLTAGDLYEELAYSLKAAVIKVDKILEELDSSDEYYSSVIDLKSLILALLSQYDHLLKGDFHSAQHTSSNAHSLLQSTSNLSKDANENIATDPAPTPASQSAMDLLIDLDVGSSIQPNTSNAQIPFVQNSSPLHLPTGIPNSVDRTETPPAVGAISLSENFSNMSLSSHQADPSGTNVLPTTVFSNEHVMFQLAPKKVCDGRYVLLATYSNSNSSKSIEDLQSFIALPKKYALELKPQSGTRLSPLQQNGIHQEMFVSNVSTDTPELPMRFKFTYYVNNVQEEHTGQSTVKLN